MDLLYTILITEADTPPSKDPTKMRVTNRESGATYYIDRHNFDPNVHSKSEKKKSMPAKEKSSGDKKKSSGGGGKFSLGGDAAKDLEKSTGGDDKKEKKNPDQELQAKIGSPVLVSQQQRDKVQHDAINMRPDLKEKLLSFNLASLVDKYNKVKQSKDDAAEAKSIAVNIQKIAIAQYSAVATMDNDPVTINYTKIFKSYAPDINDILRSGEHVIDKDELENEMREKGIPKELAVLLNINYAIYIVDEHFTTPGAILPNDITVYRAVDNKVLDVFLKAKTWIDNAFVSTSVNPLITDTLSSGDNGMRVTLLKIKLKRGNRVLMLSCKEDPYCIESEIILPRGCKFTIGDKSDKNGTDIYDVTVEIPDAR